MLGESVRSTSTFGWSRLSTEEHAEPGSTADGAFADVVGSVAEALLSDELDLIDVLDQLLMACLSILGVDAAAVLIDDQNGHLIPVASSSEEARLLELFQVHMNQGPCLDAIRGGTTVFSHDLQDERERWPAFCDAALEIGYHSVVAVPMRLNGTTIGGLNIFSNQAGQQSDERRRLGTALGHLAALAISHQQSARRSAALAEQLQHALSSRVVIEQAKGVLAERLDLTMEAAFDRIRRYARDHNQKLGEVCAGVISGEITPTRS
jgi:GAF domain-containing protein